MEHYREIAKILTNFRSKKIDLLYSVTKNGKDKYVQVAEAFAQGKIGTDGEIAAKIDADKSSGKYWMFKLRLKEKLLNSFLFLDLDDTNSTAYLRAVKTCGRNCYGINMLLMFSASHAATSLAKITLKLALEFELYDTALFCARVLRKQYAFMGNTQKYNEYNAQVEKCYLHIFAEDKADEYLQNLYVNQANSNIYTQDVIELSREQLRLSASLFDVYPTYLTGLRYYRLKAIYEDFCQDYAVALETWQAFENFIDGYKGFEYKVRMGESALQQLYCHLCTGNYLAGSECAHKCETLFALHSNNWFIYKEYYFLLCMHTQNYEEANHTIQLIHSIPHFKVLYANRQQKWKIFEAYNHIVQKARSTSELYSRKFRLVRFLNEIPTFNKDKEGFNTAVLIIQIILLILDGHFTKLPDKMEALKRYANRYFNKEAVYKSHIFMKMLLIADKCNYDVRVTKTKTKYLFEALQPTIYAHGTTYDGIEIVPYRDLWEMVLEALKK